LLSSLPVPLRNFAPGLPPFEKVSGKGDAYDRSAEKAGKKIEQAVDKARPRISKLASLIFAG
jgi:hypothetical protein